MTSREPRESRGRHNPAWLHTSPGWCIPVMESTLGAPTARMVNDPWSLATVFYRFAEMASR